MAVYQFVNRRTGDVGEFVYPMADAPPIGSEVERDGETWVRIVSPVRIAADGFNGDWRFPSRAPQLNPNEVKLGGRDKYGMVVVRNAKERREICARHGYGWD